MFNMPVTRNNNQEYNHDLNQTMLNAPQTNNNFIIQNEQFKSNTFNLPATRNNQEVYENIRQIQENCNKVLDGNKSPFTSLNNN